VVCCCVHCVLQACSRQCFVAICGSFRRPGRKLGARLRVCGCVDCLRRRAGEGVDQDWARVGGGGRVRRRRVRHCHEGRASVVYVGEDVAIVMG
jgi:hypothetical protein